MRRFGILFALISTVLCAQDAREALNQGVAAFKSANYQKAIQLFQQEVAAYPNDVNGHLYLASTYMTLWIPGLATPENEANARSADTEFRRALELDGNNTIAVASMASLAFNEAASLTPGEKLRKLDEALDWYRSLASLDPMNKVAYYSMGVIAWSKWYPALMAARASLGMRPEAPGPLMGPIRQQLKIQYSAMIEEGIANLNHALELDSNYDDAMAYLNLLIRERADLLDTKEEYKSDVATADAWVQKNLDTKRAKAQAGIEMSSPQGREGGGGSRTPVRDNGQTVKPVSTVEPVYPPLAVEARIQGTVRFVLTIAKDGSIQNVQLISGHPLLVRAATDAVKQYVYRPVLLNGSPVEAITQVDVKFALGN